MHAFRCPGATSCNGGTSRAHSATAIGQRGWKGQPVGGWLGLGAAIVLHFLFNIRWEWRKFISQKCHYPVFVGAAAMAGSKLSKAQAQDTEKKKESDKIHVINEFIS